MIEATLPYRYTVTKRDKLERKSDACIYEIRDIYQINLIFICHLWHNK